MSVSSNLMGEGWPKATPSITVVLGVGLCWPQVVLGVVLATCGVVLWVPVTKLEVVLCPLAFGLLPQRLYLWFPIPQLSFKTTLW